MLLVLLFRSSSALASAYGISVTGTMVVTAMMGFVVIWKVWKWSPLAAAALIAPFLFLDLTFLAANLLKVFEGGWVPLALGGVVMLLMYTWRRGSRLLFEKIAQAGIPAGRPGGDAGEAAAAARPGTAVFLTSDPTSAPTALMHSLKHYKVLHEKNVILTIETAPTPRIDPAERVRMEQISATFSKVTLRFGFMESPNVPKALAIARKLGWQFDIMSTSFFLSRRALKPAAHSGMPRWQDHLFIALSRTRQRRHRLFPDSDRARGRGRNAGHDLDRSSAIKRPLRRLIFRRRGDFGGRKLAGGPTLRSPGCRCEDVRGGSGHQVHDLTPEEVSKGIAEGRYLLVDVREPNEVAAEAYPDARRRSALDLRSPGDPRPARQAGRVRLPLRQALGDGLARGAGRRACPTTSISPAACWAGRRRACRPRPAADPFR